MAVYVMSDIHGLKKRFDLMLKTIDLKADDKVYFLGDVIDRGEDGIALLEQIMEDERFTLFMGNHEMMMLKCLQSPTNSNFTTWFCNGGHVTHFNYLRLDKSRQLKILNYLNKLPLALCDLKVNDRYFYLTHAYGDSNYMHGFVYLDDVDDPYRFIWERNIHDLARIEGRTIIAGHTISALLNNNFNEPMSIYHDGKDLVDAKYINIDCGCASKSPLARFACIRLDDMQVFYV